MALGTLAQAVNSKKCEVWVGSSSNTWTPLQNARALISHPIYREPTTGGTVTLFTGAADVNLSGSLLFTVDEYTAVTYGFGDLSTVSSSTGEVPAVDWAMKLTDKTTGSTILTLTFSNAKLSVVDISKPTEGAVKVDITVVVPDIPLES